MVLKKLTTEQQQQVLGELLPSMIEQKLSHWRGGDITGTDRNMRGSILLWLKDEFDLWSEQGFEEILERECPGSSARRLDREQVGFQGYGYYNLNIVEEMMQFSFLKRYLSSLMEKGLVSEEPSLLASRIKSLFQYENNSSSYLSMIKALSLGEQLSIDDLFECSTLRCPDTIFIKRLGQGKGGTTYKVYSENLQQYRAIKILNPSWGNPEAVLMARLSGKDLENIVQIYDAGNHLVTVGREKAYTILMEYIDGQTLEEILKERKLTLHEVFDYSAQILNGIQSLRKHGITHRDLNLRNIKVNSQGEVKILDFGIATDEPHPEAKNNRKFGTPEGEEADDLISFGLLVYQMITGQHLIEVPRKEAMSSNTFADRLNELKPYLYKDGKVVENYHKQVQEKCTLLSERESPDFVGTSYSPLIEKESSRLQKIIFSALERMGLDLLKSHYPLPYSFYFMNKRELIGKLYDREYDYFMLEGYAADLRKQNNP